MNYTTYTERKNQLAEYDKGMIEVEKIILESLVQARDFIQEGCSECFKALDVEGRFNLQNAKATVAKVSLRGCEHIIRELESVLGKANKKHYDKIVRRVEKGTISEREATKYAMSLHINTLLNTTKNLVAGRAIEQFDKAVKFTPGKATHIVNETANQVCFELVAKFDAILGEQMRLEKQAVGWA